MLNINSKAVANATVFPVKTNTCPKTTFFMIMNLSINLH